MHLALKPLAIVLIAWGKDVPTPATLQAILKLTLIHITIGIMILAQALHAPQPTLTLIPLLGSNHKLSLTITMPIIKIALIDFTISKLIYTLTKLRPIHELSLEYISMLSILVIELLAFSVLKVL